MSPVRLVFLVTACTALAAPIAGHAAPSATTRVAGVGACDGRMTLTERRVTEHANAGTRELVRYVHRTQPIYQITVEEAVAMVDAQRTRRAQCAGASPR